MTQGYIVIDPIDPTQSTYLVVPSNKSVEAYSPFPGRLHILCVIRDVGDPCQDKLISYLRAFINTGLSALPSTYREVWNEYKEWMQTPNRQTPAFRKIRAYKSARKPVDRSEDPNFMIIKLCAQCNRPVRLGLFEKKHGPLCRAQKIAPSKQAQILEAMGITLAELQSTIDLQTTRASKPS